MYSYIRSLERVINTSSHLTIRKSASKSHQSSIALTLSLQLPVLFIILFEGFVILLQVVFIGFRFICVLRHFVLLFIVGIFFLFVVVMVLEDPLD